MASRGDKIEKGVDAVVPEAGITLNARLFGKNVIVLALEVTDDFLEAVEVSGVRPMCMS